jgi:hypothetical protein
MGLSSTERSRKHREKKKLEKEQEERLEAERERKRADSRRAVWGEAVVSSGIIYPGERAPLENAETAAEALLSDRRFAAALRIPTIQIRETPNQFFERILHEWSKYDGPGLLLKSGRFSRNEMFLTGEAEEFDPWWTASDDKEWSSRPFTQADIDAMPRLQPPFGPTDAELQEIEDQKRIDASYDLPESPAEIWAPNPIYQVSFAYQTSEV